MTQRRSEPPIEDLYDDYLAKVGTRRRALEATATRMESRGVRDLLAYGATHGARSSEDLAQAMRDRAELSFHPQNLASLARIRALQNFDPEDRAFAIEALAKANSNVKRDEKSVRYRLLEVQLLLEAGDYSRAQRALEGDPKLKRAYPELSADLTNPFGSSPFADAKEWHSRFNVPFRRFGHESVTVNAGPGLPFDRLAAEAPKHQGTRLISVIMTTFKPDRNAFLSSVRSILNQTWQDLELIIVDDASPTEYVPILQEAESLDPRITLHQLTMNRGTYVARNWGLTVARGDYITGQDDDDWSHPRRLEVQATALDKDNAIPATRVASLTSYRDLTRTRPGQGYIGENSSSLMFRRDWVEALGGYLPIRRAADNEFHRRLEAISGQKVAVIKDPLTIIRIADGSLSRADYRAGWSHPARRSFRATYTHWHATRPPEALKVDPNSIDPPIPVPRRFEITKREPIEFDVVFAGDWSQYGGPQKSMLEEIFALRQQGLRVGILHLEAVRFMTPKPPCEAVQALILAGEVTELFIDDTDTVRLLILRYPPILQFEPAHRSSLNIQQMIIVANQAPSERDGSDIRYRPSDCTRNAEYLFGQHPTWVPQGPTVRDILRELLPSSDLAPFDMPGILNVDDWATPRKRFRSHIPVIGRHSRDNAMKWPGDPSVLRKVYPVDGSVDVRVMGGGKTPRNVLREDHDPAAWLVLGTDELPVRTFLNSIDYFVYYQHEHAYDAFGRATLEAIAAGCVAILPHSLEPTFGKAAMYASADEAIPLVKELYANPQAHWKQVSEANRVLRERFSYTAYADRVSSILNQSAIVSR